MLTGLYPHQAGIGQMTFDKGKPGYRGWLQPDCVTIAEVLRTDDVVVDVARAREAGDPADYTAVVVGSSVHAGRLPREVRRFVARNAATLAAMPVAYFAVCYTMIEDTPENRRRAMAYLDPLAHAAPDVDPVDVGLFAGAVLTDSEEFGKLFPLLKFPLRAMAEQGDQRDWEMIRAWAEGLRVPLGIGPAE